MSDDNFLQRIRQRQQLEQNELQKNANLIEAFVEFARRKGIQLSKGNIRYIQKIGLVAEYPNILQLLNEKVKQDKEELVDFEILRSQYTLRGFNGGYFYADDYIAMAHPYFRRGYYIANGFTPRFVDLFCKFSASEMLIAMDFDRVRINVDESAILEFDTWFGADFKADIEMIEDGIVKLRPPLDIPSSFSDMLFGNTYSLDIKWKTKDDIKVFYLEEFKDHTTKIEKHGVDYHPVRYIHAEYDLSQKCFRHFDGAIHFHTENEYFSRRDNDLNYNSKNDVQIKTLSQKLFKLNGQIGLKDWVELTSHFLQDDPLIIEYFEGKLPAEVTDMVDAIRKSQSAERSGA